MNKLGTLDITMKKTQSTAKPHANFMGPTESIVSMAMLPIKLLDLSDA